jgi:hypothetical protein
MRLKVISILLFLFISAKNTSMVIKKIAEMEATLQQRK